MIYLDTSIIISFMDKKDPNHTRAKDLIEDLKEYEKVVSKLTQVELASVYARGGIEEPQAFAIYSINAVKAKVPPVDFNAVLLEAFKLSNKVKLRTLDLLHIAVTNWKRKLGQIYPKLPKLGQSWTNLPLFFFFSIFQVFL